MKKIYLVFAVFLIATFILAACAPASQPEDLTTSQGMPEGDAIPAEGEPGEDA